MSLFTTRKMLQVLEQAKPAQSFLRDRYFSNVEPSTTEHVDIDIVKGKRKLAPFVHPNIGGKTVERAGRTVNSYKAPEVSPDMVTTAEDLMKRAPGEVYGENVDPNVRAARQIGKDLAELDDMITRREEAMCAQALFTGQILVKGDGYDEVLQYWPTNPADQPYVALAAGARWNEATADVLGDLRGSRRTIMQNSGVSAIDVVLGQDAIDALLGNEKLQKLLDLRRVDMGQISPQELPGGVTYYGHLKGVGLDLWGYDEWYLDENGDEQPMVPAKSVLIGSPLVRTTMAYGAVSLMRGTEGNQSVEIHAGRRVPDSWTQRKNPAGRIVQIKSRPLPIIHQIDGFRVLKVLA